MVKKKQSKKNNTNSVLFGVIGLVVVVLGILFITTELNKRKEMENVKGESTVVSNDGICNMTTNPARTCASGYECRKNPNENPRFVGGAGICMKQDLANAGEACGRSINQECKKDLICAPLSPSYRILATKASEVESTTESETVSSYVQKCIGKTEDEIKIQDECYPYIPYYGACVKKGVWPPSPLKPAPTPPSTCRPRTGCMDPPSGQTPCMVKAAPGTIFCTPTPTPTVQGCNKSCNTDKDCISNFICTKTANGNKCRNPQCYSVGSCNCYATPTPTWIPLPT